jgi:tetratricopeptide (TPR) repeat protein
VSDRPSRTWPGDVKGSYQSDFITLVVRRLSVATNPMTIQSLSQVAPSFAPETDIVSAAEQILRRYGARAITMLTAARPAEDGRLIPARLSANDCYVALDEACRKVARVALRKFRLAQPDCDFGSALPAIFPDPAAYLARAIKSVIADEARTTRRELPAVSLETPIGADHGDGSLHLGETVAENRSWKLPEQALVEQDERTRFRSALAHAMKAIPPHYLDALKRDVARDRERQAGQKMAPESDRERQTVCRARAALAEIIRRECGEDNPFVRQLAQQRNSRVRKKVQPSSKWSGERQEALFRKLMQTGWVDRASTTPDGKVDEAIVNDVSAAQQAAPPSPEMRQAMRVLDLYTVDYARPRTPAAQELYQRARELRRAGHLEEALKLFKATYDAEPAFIEALNEVGVVNNQLGNLRDALKTYLSIIERDPPGDHKYIAATNAADIYMTWFDAGRNKEKNIELAIHYAKLAMRKPTPMRACNLLQAYTKDRYYEDARRIMDAVLRENSPNCPAEKFLQTLFQIRDADLVAWWGWLENELSEEESR